MFYTKSSIFMDVEFHCVSQIHLTQTHVAIKKQENGYLNTNCL